MKKSIILFCTIMISYYLQAQNPPVVEKAAPKSNNTLPSNGTLGSKSGVNPAGNPGTITSFSGNSNSINTIATPNPNVEPGVFLSSSPEGTVVNTTVTNGTNVQRSTTVTSNGAAITTIVETEPNPVVGTASSQATKPTSPDPVVAGDFAIPPVPASIEHKKEYVVKKEKPIPAYSPVLGNFIPEQVINKIKAKYGSSVYDIKTVTIAQTNTTAYLVRLSENGKFRNELFYDEK